VQHRSSHRSSFNHHFHTLIMSAPTPAEMALWPAPNYVNPATMASATISVTTITTLTMLPFVISRVYFRTKLKGRLSIDDIVIVIAAVRRVRDENQLTGQVAHHHIHGSCNLRNKMGIRIPPLGRKTRVGSHLQEGTIASVLVVSNPCAAGSCRRCALRRLRHASEDLGLLHLPRSVSITKEHHFLLDHDYVPQLLVDQHGFGDDIPVHVRTSALSVSLTMTVLRLPIGIRTSIPIIASTRASSTSSLG
jgi:hypothetical protein